MDWGPDGVVVSVTVYLALGANVCDMVTPVPVAPSPKFQLYDVAFVDELASNEHVRLGQLVVNCATEGGGSAELFSL